MRGGQKTERKREGEREREREGEREKEKERERETARQRDRETDREEEEVTKLYARRREILRLFAFIEGRAGGQTAWMREVEDYWSNLE